ncbi:MAG TPA: single-stranded DNA-binding protein [Geminicoccaceae bacterium]|nr:single-stranded DNA-binding protein [Geminicoccaceae bacterium]
MFALSVLVGRLGRDPELRTTQAGHEMAQLSVATSRRIKREAQWEEHTEWHSVTLWGQPAGYAAEQVHKGDLVLIVGEPRSRSWEDAQGAKRVAHEVVVGGPQHVFRRLATGGDNPTPPRSDRPAPSRSTAELADELPF